MPRYLITLDRPTQRPWQFRVRGMRLFWVCYAPDCAEYNHTTLASPTALNRDDTAGRTAIVHGQIADHRNGLNHEDYQRTNCRLAATEDVACDLTLSLRLKNWMGENGDDIFMDQLIGWILNPMTTMFRWTHGKLWEDLCVDIWWNMDMNHTWRSEQLFCRLPYIWWFKRLQFAVELVCVCMAVTIWEWLFRSLLCA